MKKIYYAAALAAASAILAYLSFKLISAPLGPDERSHIHMLNFLAHEFSIPPLDQWRFSIHRAHSYHLFSPLPYYVYIPFLWLGEWYGYSYSGTPENLFSFDFDGICLPRLGGLIFVVLQLLVTIRLLAIYLPGRWLILGAAGVINLMPEVRAIHGYVNADSYTILTSTLLLLSVSRSHVKEHLDIWDTAIFALALALAMHGKDSALVVTAFLGAAFCLRLFSRIGFSINARHHYLLIAVGLLLGGLNYLHSYTELANGQILAGETHLELASSTFTGNVKAELPLAEQLRKEATEFSRFWPNLWGLVARREKLPDWFMAILASYFALGLFALWAAGKGNRPQGLVPLQLASLAMPITYLVLATHTKLGIIAGRLLLPSQIPLFMLSLIGYYAYLENKKLSHAYWLVPALTLMAITHAQLFYGILNFAKF
ncbi:MAG: hypothetical protein KDD42_04730 [Bdellovibrionales bacterium]|nr:hypothetical protein [Bdellovibrionales bacterium]